MMPDWESHAWEHQVWVLDTTGAASSIREDLDRWGREAWELVSVVSYEFNPNFSRPQLVAIFKRPKLDEPLPWTLRSRRWDP